MDRLNMYCTLPQTSTLQRGINLMTDRRPELLLTRGISTWNLISLSNCMDARCILASHTFDVHCLGRIDYLLPCEYSGSRHIFSVSHLIPR
jgi:hypothetical protein